MGLGKLAVIALVILVVFGAGRLPEVMGDLGKGIKSFKDGMKDEDKAANDEKKS